MLLRRIVADALDHTPAERDGFLVRACGDDLEILTAARRLLSYASVTDLSQEIVAPSPQDEEPPPQRIGEYEILGRLGAGGMGVVYLGVDPALQRDVAIKVIPTRFAADEAATDRLGEEARLLARLNHPNIATVHSLEQDGDTTFLTMECVPGKPAGADAAPDRTTDEVLGIAHQIASAVEAAHASGVVHRDLKPSNILVTDSGMVKVLDFGLAHLVTHDDDDSDAGAPVRGTPGYMSPEQIRGERTDAHVDVWSFGCVLFELATGTRLLPGTTERRLEATLRCDGLPAGRASELPPPLTELVDGCLKARSGERIPSMTVVREKIEEIQEARDLERLRKRLGSDVSDGTHRLPRYPTRLFGRAEDVDRVLQFLDERACVVIVGWGGTGKTRLAVEVAHASASRFPGGRWFVDLSASLDRDQVESQILLTLGLRAEPGGSAVDTIADALGGKPVLVVLDNCEQAADACAILVSELTARLPSLCMIVTSREQLPIAGGQIVPLEPLPVPPPDADLGTAARHPSTLLFADRGATMDPDFRLTEHNVDAVAEICRRVDGLPLAIELVATHLELSTPAELLQDLGHRLEAARPVPGGPDRHRSLEAVLAWSHDQLPPAERVLLRRLSVFRGGWSLTAAQAVCSNAVAERSPENDRSSRAGSRSDDAGAAVGEWQIRALTQALVSKSLIVRRTVLVDGVEQSRYDMLLTVREFADARLEAAGEQTEFRRRHFRYFEGLPDVSREDRTARMWVKRLEVDDENFMAALSREYRRSVPISEAAALARSLLRYWSVASRWQQGRQVCEGLLADIERLQETNTRHHGYMLCATGHIARLQGDVETATTCLEAGRAVGDHVGDDEVVQICDTGLTNLARFEGRYEDALVKANQRVDHWDHRCENASNVEERVIGMRRLAVALLDRSQISGELGKDRDAAADLTRCLGLHETIGDAPRIANISAALGAVKRRLGDVEGARADLTKALGAMRQMGPVSAEGVSTIIELATIALEENDLEEAVRLANEADEIAGRIGARFGQASADLVAGQALTATDAGAARVRLERSLEVARRTRLAAGLADALTALAELALVERRFREAWDHASEAVGARKAASGGRAAMDLATAARARLGLGDATGAARLLGAAHRAVERGDGPLLGRSAGLVEIWKAETRRALPSDAFRRAWNEGVEAEPHRLLADLMSTE